MPNVPDGGQIRAALIDAVAAQDHRLLAQLCATHQDTIRREFAAWIQVPVELRTEQAMVQRYAQGLITVAQFFATQLGDTALMSMMTGPPESNPVAGWQRALGQAQELMGQLRFGEARQALSAALAETRGAEGTAADSFLPVALGMFGQCCFQLGDAAAAVEPTATALRLCQQQGDREGVLAYQGSLFEIHRYLGQAEAAAAAAEGYAEEVEAAGEAAAWRRHARLVRAGEPLNRVVVVIDGEQRELSDVHGVGERRVQFVFQRNRLTLEPSRHRTGEGEQLGGQGRHDEALALFQEAAQLDHFDPHPRYLSGLALLLLRRYTEAVTEYEATERLAPGWFNCRADLWTARALASGALDYELFQLLYLLQDGPFPPPEKVKMAEAAMRAAPRLAPLYLFQGQGLAAMGEQDAAERAYRSGLEHAAEPDLRSRLLLALSMVSSSARERDSLLSQVAEMAEGNLIAVAMATVAIRSL